MVTIGHVCMGEGAPIVLIAGPCVIEDEKTVMSTAERLCRVTSEMGVPLVFKASYEKDNRSTIDGYRGPGLREGLRILARVREEFGVPVLSDVHRETDVAAAADVLDALQIPAFLCQQTSLLLAVGLTGKPVNIKKGQFMAPENMAGPVGKVRSAGNNRVIVTERGSCFGYNRLIADMCAIPTMQSLGVPVVFDATHIVRRHGLPSADPEGGSPQFIRHLARAGVAVGCDALFVEVHPNPAAARCDAASTLELDHLPRLLAEVLPIAQVVRSQHT